MFPLAAFAEQIRIATYNTDLSRKGPGLMLRDIIGRDAQVLAAAAMVDATDADVILLTDVDYDLQGAGLNAFNQTLAVPYPHSLALRPNTGMATGLDMDGDGRSGGAGDAQGFGFFSGDGGMALLSRFPLGAPRDFSAMLWVDLPSAMLPADMTAEARAVQRLSTTGHWDVPVMLPSGAVVRLLAFHATPPVFDGPEDRNGRRNHDESVFWIDLIEGRLPFASPEAPFVILGDANADPVDGDGLPDGIARLLAHPMLQDPQPRGAVRDPFRRGDASLHTAVYDRTGGLRLEYVLPSAGIPVMTAGLAGTEGDLAATAQAASRHVPVWVDMDIR
ncbi:endonuclease/exonuclease/phosphatase family protein [Falsirhodobacter sp. alg1]|uniref:endonuclease/exonuclease/phosphatase family protein n=1 Tax=Falsirhodobacter sp. alg1 TaxID=1472418 RepID=UPI0005EEACF5|nr:endonuclease/exonuclease/phosphatase family protein [Falsirhodobacter sp. alg1]